LIAQVPDDPTMRERRRQQVIAGGYRLTHHDPLSEHVTLVGVGAIMPEVVAAAKALESAGIVAGVVCLTSPDLVFRSFQHLVFRSFQQRGRREAGVGGDILSQLFPAEHPVPLVTILDGHPHTLSFLAGARGDQVNCLGVSEFGQSSNLTDAYALHRLDAGSIVDAALNLLSL